MYRILGSMVMLRLAAAMQFQPATFHTKGERTRLVTTVTCHLVGDHHKLHLTIAHSMVEADADLGWVHIAQSFVSA